MTRPSSARTRTVAAAACVLLSAMGDFVPGAAAPAPGATPPPVLEPGNPIGNDVPGAVVGPDDAQPDDPPAQTVAPPPPPAPLAPAPEQEEMRRRIAMKLEVARAGLADAERRQVAAATDLAELDRLLAVARAGLPDASARSVQASSELAGSHDRLRRWAVELYAGRSLAPVRFVLDTHDLRQLPRRIGLADGGAAAARREFQRRRRAVGEADATLAAAAARADELAATVEKARRLLAERVDDRERWRQDVSALEAGEDVVIDAVAFPVAGETRFTDSFGAPRMTGTRFVHSHQGVDIFAESGTPVVAFERGVLARVGNDVLGGKKLWLVGQSGTRYYYAHLRDFVPGTTDGQVVEAGQVLASVGTTGNAATTPPHLHFEIRPGGGPAVNPYPVLRQIAQPTGS